MTSKQFRAWRKRTNLSQTQAAQALGISKRMVGYYDNGFKIPKYIELACAEIERRITNN